MKKALFNDLIQSVNQAVAIERGHAKPSRTIVVKSANDVVRVRTKSGISQTNRSRNGFAKSCCPSP